MFSFSYAKKAAKGGFTTDNGSQSDAKKPWGLGCNQVTDASRLLSLGKTKIKYLAYQTSVLTVTYQLYKIKKIKNLKIKINKIKT